MNTIGSLLDSKTSCLIATTLRWVVAFVFTASLPASALNVFTFEGIGDNNWIGSYYAGGSGGNYGVWINGYGLVDSDAGGNGLFANEPSASTTLLFYDNNALVQVQGGFTAVSFAYSARNNPVTCTIYSGTSGTGTVLASVTLTTVGVGAGDPTGGGYGVWATVAPSFSGVARSMVFTGAPGVADWYDYFLIDNIGLELSKPTVSGVVAARVSSTSATFSATINPNGSTSTASFEYGLTPALGSTSTITLSPAAGTAPQNVSRTVSGLSPGAFYYYRAVATNGIGTTTVDAVYNNGAPGAPDIGFSGDGIQITPFTTPSSDTIEYGNGMAVQADGKIILAGYANTGANPDFLVARYLPEGTLDPGFGSGGRVTVDFGSDDHAYAVAVQGDGKIVVAGRRWSGTIWQGALARLNPNGSLDPTFDGDGRVNLSIEGAFRKVSIQANGGIVAGGFGYIAGSNDFLAARFMGTNGALDTSFNGDGIATVNMNNTADYAQDLVIQPDGKIVLAGQADVSGDWDYAIARFTFAGDLDSSFGSGGKRLISMLGDDQGWSVALAPGGRIVVGGTSRTGSTIQFGVVALTSTGTNDNSFSGDGLLTFGSTQDRVADVAVMTDGRIVVGGMTGSAPNGIFTVAVLDADGLGFDEPFSGDGQATADPSAGHDVAGPVLVQSDGKILQGGTSGGNFVIVRYGTDGTQDSSFGTGGVVNAELSVFVRSSQAFAVAVQSDGKIVAAGEVDGGGQSNFALTRYLSDGSLDASFGTGGQLTTPLSAQDDYSRAVAVLPSGNILVAGTIMESGATDFALVRYLPNGTLDSTFGTAGVAKAGFNLGGSNNDVANAMAVQADGKIVVVGYAFTASGTTDIALARFTESGGLDSSFDGDGKLVTVETGTNDSAAAVAIQPDGKIVVAGRTPNSFQDFFILRYNTNGSMDSGTGADSTLGDSFGPANGRITVSIGDDDFARGIALQPDGKILISGYTSNGTTYGFAALRFTAAGVLDPTFDGDGKVTTLFAAANSGLHAFGTSCVLQPDCRLVQVGMASNGTYDDMAVARYNPDGTLDTTFDGDGKALFNPGPQTDRLHAVTLSGNGDIVAAGLSQNSSGISQFAVVRLIGNSLPGVWNLAGVQSNDLQTVRISGQVDPAGLSTTMTAEWGTSAALGNSISLGTLTGIGLQAFNASFGNAGGLTLGTTYYYRVVATNANGTTTSTIQSFFYGPGILDTAFGTGGKVVTDANGTDDGINAVEVQSDGKIVVAGYCFLGSRKTVCVARYLANGTLDSSFDSDGKTVVLVGTTEDEALDLAVQGDGKIVVVGRAHNSSNYDFFAARLNSNGTLDTSFNGTGKAITPVGSSDDHGYSVVVQNDGKIIVAGTVSVGGNLDFGMVRYAANGALDTTSGFGSGGKVITPIGPGHDQCTSMVLQSDGKILLAGDSYSGASVDFAIARYNSNGTLDSSFDSDGKRITDFFGIGDDLGRSVALQRDGKIVVAGFVNAGGGNFDIGIARYTTNGAADPTFDGDGKNTIAVGGGSDNGLAVALQPDGKIVVAGSAGNATADMACVRFNPDGTQDATFVNGGKATVVFDSSANDVATSVAVQQDGTILLAGRTGTPGNNDFALARLLGGPNDLLVNGGFEANEALGGGTPAGFGDWKQDQANTVGTENGITPYEGSSMLKFLGTEVAGGSTNNACQVIQYVPMSGYSAEIAAGNGVRVNVTGRFNRVAATDSEFLIELVGYNGTPTNPGTVTTSRSQSLISDGNPSTWEPLGNYIDLPMGTTMVAVYLTAVENITNNPSSPEFDGNYADAIQLTVRTDFTAPTLSPVTIASNNANTAWAKAGDTVTVSFTASEPIQAPVVTLLGSAATVANTGGNNWTATATVGTGTAQGVATFSIAVVDLIGNAALPVTATTNVSGVTVDKTAPTLILPANLIVAATSPAGANVAFSATATDNLDPSPGVIATPASGSTFPLGITTVNTSSSDAAGNTANGSFTISVGNLVDGVVFSTPASVPLTDNGFTATGQSVGPMTLGFDPAPGQVLTLVNNTSVNPIGGSFTNLPDGGTITTNFGGRNLLFIANYSGGDGNDLTLTLLNPEIAVEQPLLTDIPDGGSKGFGTMVLGSPVSLVFTLKNTGQGILNGLTVTNSGTDLASFIVTVSPTAPVAGPSGTTTFTVQFNPATSGAKTAAIHIASDDTDENPFDITLTGQALSVNDDTDTDGLNDAAEFLMNALGYDWQVSQPALVSALMTNANVAGLFTPTQVQALHVGTPLIQRNPATGQFKLTIGLEKSTDLSNFSLYPFTAPQTTVNGQGKIEFLFSSPDDAAFFRLGAE